jgi:HSP20 family protein
MLMFSDPFRQFDRVAQQVPGTVARPAAMPMDAWRERDKYVVALDLPGVDIDSVDLNVAQNEDTEMFASERPRGVFSRQLVLGDALDTDNIKVSYDAGVLTPRIPVVEEATPRKIEIESRGRQQ